MSTNNICVYKKVEKSTLPGPVEAIQMSTNNIYVYKEVEIQMSTYNICL